MQSGSVAAAAGHCPQQRILALSQHPGPAPGPASAQGRVWLPASAPCCNAELLSLPPPPLRLQAKECALALRLRLGYCFWLPALCRTGGRAHIVCSAQGSTGSSSLDQCKEAFAPGGYSFQVMQEEGCSPSPHTSALC